MRSIQTITIVAFIILFGCKRKINTKQKIIQQDTITANTINSKKINSISDSLYRNKERLLPVNRDYVYDKKIDINSVKYKKQNPSFNGAEEWFCDKNYLRFLPVLTKDDIKLILVPQDCGDFNYRYYLLAIYKNTIVSNLYVEGEWYEPGVSKKEYKEITSFRIDSNYNIIVRKEIYSEGVIDSTVINEYNISATGLIKKIEKH